MKTLELNGLGHGMNARLCTEEDESMGEDFLGMRLELPDRGLRLTIEGPREEVRYAANMILLAESEGDLPAAFDDFLN